MACPPTPPLSPKAPNTPIADTPTDVLLATLRRLAKGVSIDTPPSQQLLNFALSPAAYADLQADLQADPVLLAWYADKARYDYDPDRAVYTLRMPGKLHEDLTAYLEEHWYAELLPKLRKIKGLERKTLRLGRSRTLDFRIGEDEGVRILREGEDSGAKSGTADHRIKTRTPDFTLFYKNSHFPTLVAEISHSQRRRDIEDAADDYIVYSAQRTRCVIGLDCAYEPPRRKSSSAAEDSVPNKAASISVWRPDINDEGEGISRRVVNAQLFRDAQGRTCPGSISLTLADLVPASVYRNMSPSEREACPDISIDFELLAQWLKDSESATIQNSPPPGPTKMRKRKRNPEATILDAERESKFRRQEDQMEANEKSSDRTFPARIADTGNASVVTPARELRPRAQNKE
ncbi:hypothetical protein CBER1_10936 [Cercospora berteroae]|uniref:Uncharacterized protein n=1 Tax=Cercospora berteroae TaxID=357750 RepID=A0A2S6C9R8_9PEZI|nr:hypothetical protein CBER1_10936 [Cercospora berteroae]